LPPVVAEGDCRSGSRVPENRINANEARPKSYWRRLGPGLITGASDDDPSGIATYSQAGAGFGFSLLWTMVLCLPLMSAIQEISARIGRISGRGIAGNIRMYYSPWVLYPLIFLLALANTINVGADIGAMGDAVRLLVGGSALFYAVLFAVACVVMQVFASYPRYSNSLKWLTLSLFAYVATVMMIHVPWRSAIRGTFVPSIQFTGNYWATIIAIFGTTISPYLLFWQASQETEEIHHKPADEALKDKPHQARDQFGRIRFDTYVGMGVSNLVAWFIILAAAATLHANGVTDVQTSSQAAEALRPLAGRFAFLLFALGIIGTGLLAVPVLAGSAAYAVGEALHWPTGLDRKPLEAKGFYGVLIVATGVGLAINFPAVQRVTHLSPIRALFWSAIINGVAAVPIMVVMMLMCHNKKVMGPFVNISPILRVIGWIATAAMLLAAIGLFATLNS
jgi:NRAMP (natural resistance-associated macrophage protein)-like metal ion transporter